MMDFKAVEEPSKRTTDPIVTGSSVLGIKYKDGVMIMTDTLASYGSMAMFKDVRRIVKVNEHTLVGGSGEFSDFQFLTDLLQDVSIENFVQDDGITQSPQEVHSFLTRVLYNRRSRSNPLYNQLIVGGVKSGKKFLGFVDMYGSNYEEDMVATGYGSYIALPLMRRAWRPDLSEAEARTLLEDSMRVLYYRDCRSLNRFIISRATADGVSITEPYALKTEWNFKLMVNPDTK